MVDMKEVVRHYILEHAPKPKVIVAWSYREFRQYCQDRKWNPCQIKYVDVRDMDRGLRGYRPEDVLHIGRKS